jgi:hypothetical protein
MFDSTVHRYVRYLQLCGPVPACCYFPYPSNCPAYLLVISFICQQVSLSAGHLCSSAYHPEAICTSNVRAHQQAAHAGWIDGVRMYCAPHFGAHCTRPETCSSATIFTSRFMFIGRLSGTAINWHSGRWGARNTQERKRYTIIALISDLCTLSAFMILHKQIRLQFCWVLLMLPRDVSARPLCL